MSVRPLSISLFAFVALSGVVAADSIDFDSQIRPILSDKCFQCHGPDPATREAGLRLDIAEGALADLGGYAAVVPGMADQSELYRRITSDDPYEVMPPPDSKIVVSDLEKQMIGQWIDEGGQWSKHWAFIPPESSPVPPDPLGWANNPIDHFIGVRLREAGLQPSDRASRETLIRRVTLDLTGVPPTPEEIDAFVSDDSKDAYDRVVDRLLQSPRYGERMAWPWLDAARYADTDGFQGDPTRSMWPWRDWLVDALNRNMPFDQFTIELLAGDLLDQPSPEQVLASGFNRNHMFNGEGGRIAEETRVENVFDRTETTGTVWMGLTMTCCRCHDHKYDNLSQKDYFRLYAFFDNTSETGRSGRGKTAPILNYLVPELRQELARLGEAIAEREHQLLAPNPKLDQAQANWEAEIRRTANAHQSDSVLGPWWQLGPIARDGEEAFRDSIGPEQDLDLSAVIDGQAWEMKRSLEDAKVHPLPAISGPTFFFRSIEAPSEREMSLSLGSDDAIKVFLNGKEVLARQVSRAAEPDQESITVTLQKGVNELLVKVVNFGGIGGFYFKKGAENAAGVPREIFEAVVDNDPKTASKRERLIREHFRSKQLPEVHEKLQSLRRQKKSLQDKSVKVMVMDELPENKRRTTLVLDRGAYDKPTDVKITADTPSALPSLPDDAPRNRLSLARWLVDPANPLTARVTVNRYWQLFFGHGIVKSSEDFGVQGTRPSHPQLLDWLATQFIENGWNVKAIHKLIVTSATYQQSARVDDQAMEKDPENLWLARAPRFRMPSWMLRDQALAISGLMNPEMGGPAVKPYQPRGIWADATFGKIKYAEDDGEDLYRRSLYVFWRRIVGPTMFFDSAKRQTCEVKPTRTNTPLHALTTLNETAFVEAARAMAERTLVSNNDDEERLRFAFRLATARPPEPDELRVLIDRIETMRSDFQDDPESADALLSVGQSPRAASLCPAEHAAYTVVCSLLLNLDETLSRP